MKTERLGRGVFHLTAGSIADGETETRTGSYFIYRGPLVMEGKKEP